LTGGSTRAREKAGNNAARLVENSSLHQDLMAANAKWMDAEKRVAALEHEVRTLADVGQRLTDQLTKVLYCVAT
jgi:hypothetical protein